jgi:hypothetical protein
MATISDSLYNTSAGLTQVIGNVNLACKVPVLNQGGGLRSCSTGGVEGMEQNSEWASVNRAYENRVGSSYPCALEQGVCPQAQGQVCGKSLVMRENSSLEGVVSSADGTRYTTMAWLGPGSKPTQLGKCQVSRACDPKNPGVSLLFLDGKPAVNYFLGGQFKFYTMQTVFVYMVPNAIMARVSGIDYRVDIITAAEAGNACWQGIGMCKTK